VDTVQYSTYTVSTASCCAALDRFPGQAAAPDLESHCQNAMVNLARSDRSSPIISILCLAQQPFHYACVEQCNGIWTSAP
jgi:hypothetical protein